MFVYPADPADPDDADEPGDDADISEALRDDEVLLPDLAIVRREVLGRRRALRNRNRFTAAGLMAACVLVIGSVIALAGVRANDDRSGSAASADGQISIQTWTANSYPATSAAGLSVAAPSVRSPSSTAVASTHLSSSAHLSASAQPTAGTAAAPRPTLAQHDDMYGPISHCDGVMSAWPVSGAGRIDPPALRAAINECSTMFGATAGARYTVASLRAVTEQAPEIAVNGADLSQQVLVVRLDGRFDGLAVAGYVPSTVQLYLLLEGHQWIGAYAPAPTQDLATLGSTVRTLP